MTDTAAIIDSIDIFEEVERYARGDAADGPDPQTVYRDLLEAGPVYEGDVQTELLGLGATPVSRHDGPQFTVLGFEAVAEVLRRGNHFSSSIIEEAQGAIMGRNILMMDDPEHRTHRMLVQRSFTRKAMNEWQTTLVEPLVARLIDAFIGDGRVEMVAGLARPLPVTVIHEILGLPENELDETHRLASGLLLGVTHPQVAVACARRIGELITAQVHVRRAAPADDLVSVLANERLKTGEALEDEEISNFLRLLLPAGAETTTRLLSSMMVRVLTESGLLRRLQGDRDLIPAVITETLRLHPPFQWGYRVSTEDTVLAGVSIPKGAAVSVCIGAANRDPAKFPDPERFEPSRTATNLAFGLGAHVCLGVHLARMEAEVTFGALLDRLPGLRLDPDRPAPRSGGARLSSPDAVHLLWDAAAAR